VAAAAFEAALLSGIVIGIAAVAVPGYLPQIGAALNPLFKSTVRGAYKIGSKAKTMMTEAHAQVQDIVAEVNAESAAGMIMHLFEDRRLPASSEDVVHHVEHAHTELLRHRCEPWRGLQSHEHVGKPLLPSRRHCRAAEFEVLERAQRFHRPIDELHNIHLGDAAVGIKSLSLFGAGELRGQQFMQTR
jgi:hypothetical protein